MRQSLVATSFISEGRSPASPLPSTPFSVHKHPLAPAPQRNVSSQFLRYSQSEKMRCAEDNIKLACQKAIDLFALIL